MMKGSARPATERERYSALSGCRRKRASLGPAASEGTTSLPASTRRVSGSESGFTLVETLVVVGIIGILAGISVMMMPGAILSAKADGGAARVVSVLRTAREQSIAQRRTIRVTFTPPNRIAISRVEVPGPATTVLSTALLEDGMAFRLFAGVPDTPDLFGNASATAFGVATTVAFTSEGWFVDQNGDPVNGTAFLGKASQPQSARAVTIFGPTALIREWRWNGTQWTH
jgi:prepilin-type N-terminal cleavage/methylation domain-containing protein